MNTYMRKKYVGKDEPLLIRKNKVYEIFSCENGFYKIVDETNNYILVPIDFFVNEDEPGDVNAYPRTSNPIEPGYVTREHDLKDEFEDGDDEQLYYCSPGQKNIIHSRVDYIMNTIKVREKEEGSIGKEETLDLLRKLNDIESAILIMRFGLYDGKTRTLEEVGMILGIGRERTRQIELEALRKTRRPRRSK